MIENNITEFVGFVDLSRKGVSQTRNPASLMPTY